MWAQPWGDSSFTNSYSVGGTVLSNNGFTGGLQDSTQLQQYTGAQQQYQVPFNQPPEASTVTSMDVARSPPKKRVGIAGERLGQKSGEGSIRDVLREIMGSDYSRNREAAKANRILPQVQASNNREVSQHSGLDLPPPDQPMLTRPQHPATPDQHHHQQQAQGPVTGVPSLQQPVVPQQPQPTTGGAGGAPTPIEMLDVDALLKQTHAQPQPSPKETSYRLKYRQERERREALLAQIQALLLDRNEWLTREQFIQELSSQEHQDSFDREKILEEIAKYETALSKLQRIRQHATDEEARKTEALKDCDMQMKHYRPQVTEKEAALLEQQKYYEERITELTDQLRQSKQEYKSLSNTLNILQEQVANQQSNERNVRNVLQLAAQEVDRLRKRIPVSYSTLQMQPTSSAGGVGIDYHHIMSSPTRHSEGASPPRDQPHSPYHNHRGDSPVGRRPTSDRRPVIGIEVRQTPGPDGDAVKVVALSPNGPAEQAGVQVGDFIIKVDGKSIYSKPDFAQAILNSTPGAVLPLELLRPRQANGRATFYKEFTKVVVRSAKGRSSKHR